MLPAFLAAQLAQYHAKPYLHVDYKNNLPFLFIIIVSRLLSPLYLYLLNVAVSLDH